MDRRACGHQSTGASAGDSGRIRKVRPGSEVFFINPNAGRRNLASSQVGTLDVRILTPRVRHTSFTFRQNSPARRYSSSCVRAKLRGRKSLRGISKAAICGAFTAASSFALKDTLVPTPDLFNT